MQFMHYKLVDLFIFYEFNWLDVFLFIKIELNSLNYS